MFGKVEMVSCGSRHDNRCCNQQVQFLQNGNRGESHSISTVLMIKPCSFENLKVIPISIKEKVHIRITNSYDDNVSIHKMIRVSSSATSSPTVNS